MSELFEIFMVCLFGASWPMNVIKSYKARTAKGKSFLFLMFIFVGYIFGIASKLTAPTYKWYVLMFYIINITMVSADIILYFRNRKLDRTEKKKQ